MNTLSRRAVCLALALALGLARIVLPAGFAQSPAGKPVRVTIQEEKTEVTDSVLPLDAATRVEYEYVGNMAFGVTAEGKRLTCGPGSASTMFKIDNQIFFPEVVAAPKPLSAGPNNKSRRGVQAVWTSRNGIKVTQILEVILGKPYDKNAPQKRRMDCLLIKYVVENTGTAAHNVGVRMHIDTLCVDNDGAIFASPIAHPGKLLDGIAFKGKDIPDIVEILQRPNLQNPGFKGVFSFRLGAKLEAPHRVVLTSLAAGGEWNLQTIQAMGDSAVAFYWEDMEMKPGARRELAFAYGQSQACNPENEGKVHVNFGGSFEPSKTFTVTAYVDDPVEGQNLTLLLPAGMERLDGRETQSVPPPGDNRSIVMWRCRVLAMGTFPVRIRSSNGVTETRIVTVAPAE